MRRTRSLLAAALIAAALVAAIVLIDDRPPGAAAAGAASPAAAVDAYVAGLNHRDAAAVCRLLAPTVADGVGPAIAAALGRNVPLDCAAALQEQIQEPPDPRTVDQYTAWTRATVRSRKLVAAGAGRVRVDTRIFHAFISDVLTPAETDGVHADRIWLERRSGRWFVTGPGRTFFVVTRIDAPVWSDDPPLTAAGARRTVTLKRPPRACAGPVQRVARYAGGGPAGAASAPYLDIRRVELRHLRSHGICARLTLGARPRRSTVLGVNFEYWYGSPPQSPENPGRWRHCGTSSLRIDSAGRTHAVRKIGMARGVESSEREAAALVGGRGSTIAFEIRPLRGIALRRFRFRAFAESLREPGPAHAVLADELPAGMRYLEDIPHAAPHASACVNWR